MKSLKIGLLAATLAAATQAYAGSDVYVGAGIGQGHLNVECAGLDSCDDGSTGSKIYGGYKFSPNLAVEVGYYNFGKAKLTLGSLTETVKASAVAVSAAYSAQFAQSWVFTARAGLASVKGSDDWAAESETSAQLIAGLGIGYAVTPEFSVHAAYDFTTFEVSGSSGGTQLLSLGVQYGF